MQIHRNLNSLEHCQTSSQSDQRLALAIGNFDGVHLGHQQILKLLKAQAKSANQQAAVMIFEPQPREFFNQNSPEARLQSWHEKALNFAEHGVDQLIVCDFDESFRSQSARAFCDKLWHGGVRSVLVGDDFRFGNGREGDANFLAGYGFTVIEQPSVLENGARVSSTLIRNALAQHRLDDAADMLGRPYTMFGRVDTGDKIGRQLGFPTANIRLSRLKPALHGIYAAAVTTLHERDLPLLMNGSGVQVSKHALIGAAHLGTRPAIDQPEPEWRFEVNLPNYSGNLYGIKLKVTFLKFIHGERDYDSLDALKAGIAADVEAILQFAHSLSGKTL